MHRTGQGALAPWPSLELRSKDGGHASGFARRATAVVAALPTLRDLRDPMLVRRLRLDHRLPDLHPAVGAFIGEVDLRQAPVRFDILHIHGKAYAARTNDEGGFDVMMADIGWHVGSPQRSIHQ